MAAPTGSLHVTTTKSRYKGKVYTAHLLRCSWREGRKVVHKTLSNLSHLPPNAIDAVRRTLKGEVLVGANEAVQIKRALPHGNVRAVLRMIERLGLANIISSKPSRQRALVIAMIAERLIAPSSKLAHLRHWQDTTLAHELGVADATIEELYDAMDWLLPRQALIEKKLASKHLCQGGLVLYDLSSSYYEGFTCPLAQFGYNRDGKNGCMIIVYGVLTDKFGRPVAIEVFEGNTSDPKTVPTQVDKLTQRFGLSQVVLVGDRGVLTQTQIDHLKKYPGLAWISALKSRAIKKLITKKAITREQIEKETLAEISSSSFPGERLIVCINQDLIELRRKKREALLKATEANLTEVARVVSELKPTPSEAEVGLRAGQIVNKYKMKKHFELKIEAGKLEFKRKQEAISVEAELDGIYVVRTSVKSEELDAEDVVRSYKRLTDVERVFRSLKGLDLMVRPIHHRLEKRVKAHLLLCMLAYYVEWHLRKCWASLLFQEEKQEEGRAKRDAVRPGKPSKEVKDKKNTRQTSQGMQVQSYRTLMSHLATLTRNQMEVRGREMEGAYVYEQESIPTPTQKEAFHLIEGAL